MTGDWLDLTTVLSWVANKPINLVPGNYLSTNSTRRATTAAIRYVQRRRTPSIIPRNQTVKHRQLITTLCTVIE